MRRNHTDPSYAESIIRDRKPGTPIRPMEMIDVSEEMLGQQKGGALLMTPGIPDFVLTPPGLEKLFDDVSPRERCDVLTVFEGGAKAATFLPPCAACGEKGKATSVWRIIHCVSQRIFLLLECSCGNVNWLGGFKDQRNEEGGD